MQGRPPDLGRPGIRRERLWKGSGQHFEARRGLQAVDWEARQIKAVQERGSQALPRPTRAVNVARRASQDPRPLSCGKQREIRRT